jgi:hypothetical protein
MEEAMEKPPTSSGYRDEPEDTETELNIRLSSNHET